MPRTALITGVTGPDCSYVAAGPHVAVSFEQPECSAAVDGDVWGNLIAFRTPVDDDLLTAVLWETLRVEDKDAIPPTVERGAGAAAAIEEPTAAPRTPPRPRMNLVQRVLNRVLHGRGGPQSRGT